MLPPAPGLGRGMLLSPAAVWLSAATPTPADPWAGNDAGRLPGACHAEPCRAEPCAHTHW